MSAAEVGTGKKKALAGDRTRNLAGSGVGTARRQRAFLQGEKEGHLTVSQNWAHKLLAEIKELHACGNPGIPQLRRGSPSCLGKKKEKTAASQKQDRPIIVTERPSRGGSRVDLDNTILGK